LPSRAMLYFQPLSASPSSLFSICSACYHIILRGNTPGLLTRPIVPLAALLTMSGRATPRHSHWPKLRARTHPIIKMFIGW
jgi:hypothetical protein